MTPFTPPVPGAPGEALPDHTQLPDKDGAMVTNFQENPQSALLSTSLQCRFEELHPDGHYCVGMDSGIYWKLTQPPMNGCKAPDWFYVPGVPPTLGGKKRRSYVMWQERVKPQVLIEYVSGDGSEEKDATPQKGKFWVYEKAIGAPYYAIFEGETPWLEVYHLNGETYEAMTPNKEGRFAIPPLGVEFGLWRGKHLGLDLTWLRVWDPATGEMLLSAEERADSAEERADSAEHRLESSEAALEEMQGMLQEEIERTGLLQRRADDEAKHAEALQKRAADEAKRADDQAKRAADEAKRAEALQKRAADEAKRADDQAKRAERLGAQLRALGIDPDAA